MIESLAGGGDGVGHLADGRVAFARLTAPGDRVRISYTDTQGRFVRANSAEVIEPSPKRVEPECRFFGRCGGCAWQHIAYETQIEAKREILHAAVARIGGLRQVPEIEMIASPRPYGYRSRARLLVAGNRVGYRRWRSNEIESIDCCPILLPSLDSELKSLAARSSTQSHTSGNGIEWELAAGSDGAVRSVPLPDSGEEAIEIAVEVAGERIAISPGGFAQGNGLALEALFSQVAEALDFGTRGLLLELYAGAGFFTLPLARRFDHVIAIESERAATADLAHNLGACGQSNVEVRTARVEQELVRYEGARPDAVLLDPPRAGLARGAAAAIARLNPRRIVYVSCDAATLARDLGIFARGLEGAVHRYTLVRLTGLDLFPQTPHLEVVAVLDRAISR